MAQSETCLCKHKDLSSIPGTQVETMDKVASCNPSSGEVETGRSLGLSAQPA